MCKLHIPFYYENSTPLPRKGNFLLVTYPRSTYLPHGEMSRSDREGISLSLLGRDVNEVDREGVSLSLLGRDVNEVDREGVSLSLLGRDVNEVDREGVSLSLLGRDVNEVDREGIININKTLSRHYVPPSPKGCRFQPSPKEKGTTHKDIFANLGQYIRSFRDVLRT